MLPPAAVRPPGPAGRYEGPLFDTHLHLFADVTSRFGSPDALCHYLERNLVLWAIGFYPFLRTTNPNLDPRAPFVAGGRGRIIPLIQPMGFPRLSYTEVELEAYIWPSWFFQGLGEVPLYQREAADATFEAPHIQTGFKVINQRRGIFMIHPSGGGLGPHQTTVREVEEVLRRYPDVTFLFHGRNAVDLFRPLLSKYPNAYFTLDFSSTFGGLRVGSSEQFAAEVQRKGVDRMLEEVLRVALPLLQQHPDRIMWGTDLGPMWNFDDSTTDLIIQLSRQLIGRLPPEFQENYAFRNAYRAFSRYLSAGQ